MLYQGHAPCPKYDKIYKKFLNDPDPNTEFYAYNQQMLGLYAYLTENTGEVSNANYITDDMRNLR